MTQAMLSIFLVVFAIEGILMGILRQAVRSERLASHRVHVRERNKVPDDELRRVIAKNGLVSVVFLVGLSVLVPGLLVQGAPVHWTRVVGEVVAVLFLYDGLYYFLHAAMHKPLLMRHVHGVHHKILSPSAPDSIFLNPIENLWGLGLLMACTALVGPVSLVSFGVIFLVHASLNVIVHCGLTFAHPLLFPLEVLARNHDVHHGKAANKNYASLTPLWDHLMGTFQSGMPAPAARKAGVAGAAPSAG